ncbi:RHS repeat-associated core domain-containing protein [Saccharothrix syringae]|uniref:RHS repeat protein n=1 Tax=Saccharothrix syringae TaxID=103733 RepID=A0A5Q0GWC6_SACSY|nr:RHS repeat-associated core domain-containing protein [Saccharothrix syringae]QFZ18426.1 RHS repeat protein [Saccharothrix syringae]
MRRPARRLVAGVVSLALAMTAVVPAPALARPGAAAFQPHREPSVPGHDARAVPPEPNAADAAAVTKAPEVSWPGAGVAEVALDGVRAAGATTRAGDLPVFVGRVDGDVSTAAAAPGKVRVEVLDRRLEGPVLRINRADGVRQAGPVAVEVDYSGFAHAHGGDWAVRLRLVALPECALTTPERDECRATPLATRNNGSGRLTARATAAPEAKSGLYGVMAGDSSGAGDYKESSLSPSSTWVAGGSSGDFTWNYPMDVPPNVNAAAPQLNLSYSSGSMDGRTSAANNQPSWAGEGFSFEPGGYIERRYVACSTDMKPVNNGNANNTTKTGDTCWRSDNATFTLNGKGGELVLDDATRTWRPRKDDGTVVERLTGGKNPDDNGEHWKITSRDGTEFYFGLNQLPGWSTGKEVTESVWTNRVYGNHANEPCHKTAFADSSCMQAWRWNLDYVVDRHGNTISYFYDTETNNYGRELSATKVSSYVRAGYLTRIDYGQLKDGIFTTKPVGQVVLKAADRCIPGTPAADCVAAKPANWPDTPWDQACSSTTNCKNKHSQTFWTQKRLESVTTRVWTGSAFRDVNTWKLTHTFPSPGDGTRAGLWLSSIRQTGLAGTPVELPPTTFDGIQLNNRVDAANDMVPPMNWWRMKKINTDSGGQVVVTYQPPNCAPTGTRPAPDTNTLRCHPLKWSPDTPDGVAKERTDWFHKYVVGGVTEKDLTTGVVAEETTVEYGGTPAWRHDDEDGLVPAERKTWSQWRGYEKVLVKKGDAAGGQSLTETRYYRGMDGDKTAAGGRKSVEVLDSKSGHWRDSDPLSGYELEEITYTGAGGAVMSRSITDHWVQGPTATRRASWGTTESFQTGERKSRQTNLLSDGTWRETGSDNTYDTRGVLQQTFDLNDTSTADDDTCTRYSYAAQGSLVELPYRKQTVSDGCDAPVKPENVIDDDRFYYDGNDTLGAPPTVGDVTRMEELSGWVDGAPTYVTTTRAKHDGYGRPIEVYDAKNRKGTTTYTPATGAPTSIAVTNALGHRTVTEVDPAWGEETSVVLPGDRRSRTTYDALGRVLKEWLPGANPDTRPADREHAYLFRNDGPSVVTTKDLQPDGSYDTDYELYDGDMRLRQTQAPAPGGGRTVIDHVYDARGLEVKQNGPYLNDAPPGYDVLIPDEDLLTSQTVTEYDGSDRPTVSIFKVRGVEKWRTTYTNNPDRQDVDPPTGETPETRILDADGNVVELRQYKGEAPTGDYDRTTYTYDPEGQLLSVTDPAGNVWRYTYDVRGRKTSSLDPDRGLTEYTYDEAGQLTSAKDARGVTLASTYDDLGRQTGLYEGSTSGRKRAEWTYDTVAPGMPATSTRWVDGAAYTSAVTGYDPAGRPTGSKLTIPATEGRLAGTYQFAGTYTVDGEIATQKLPAVAGFAEETLTFGYDNYGLPTTLSGKTPYVTGTRYTPYGEIESATLSTGGKAVQQTFQYEDGTRRLSRTVVQSDSSASYLSDLSYTYDAAGNIRRMSDAADSDTQCFAYDHLRRLTNAHTPKSGVCGSGELGGPAPYGLSWTFDKVGNRLSETRTGADGKSTTSNYTYPAPGQPQPHALRKVTTGDKVDQYGYDAVGNTTARKGQVLDWDAEGHLAKVTEGGKTTSFLYDASGERLIRRDATGTTLYLGATEVRVDGNGALSATRYYTHSGHVVAVRTSDGKVTWQTADHHGTAQLSIDSETQAVQRRRTTPYGEVRGAAPSPWPGERGFVNGTNDPTTGLVHLGAREYDQSTGRFTSVDPVIDHEDPQQLHGYAYANNSPVTYTDPDGRWGFSIKTITKVVFKPFVKTVVQPVTTWVTKYTPIIHNAVEKLASVTVPVIKNVVKKIPGVKKVTQTIRKVVKNTKSSVKRFYKKHVQPKLNKVKKTFNRYKKAASNGLKKATKRIGRDIGNAWDAAGKVATQFKPGEKGWGALKLGLGVAAMFFGCVVCGAAVAGMSAVDAVIAAREGDTGKAALEVAGIVTFGVGTKISQGMQTAKVAARVQGSAFTGTSRLYTQAMSKVQGLEKMEFRNNLIDGSLLSKDAMVYGASWSFDDNHWSQKV